MNKIIIPLLIVLWSLLVSLYLANMQKCNVTCCNDGKIDTIIMHDTIIIHDTVKIADTITIIKNDTIELIKRIIVRDTIYINCDTIKPDSKSSFKFYFKEGNKFLSAGDAGAKRFRKLIDKSVDTVYIKGYANVIGNEDFNKDLLNQKAERFKQYLIENNIITDDDRIKFILIDAKSGLSPKYDTNKVDVNRNKIVEIILK